MIVFKTLEWKNLLSTGNVPNKLILNKSQSTLIVGRNGEGKSTMLDALTFALFGKPFRNINKPQLVNSINQKNCVATIEFDIGTLQYKVIRGIKPNVFEIWLNGEMLNQDAAAKDYQKVLEQQILRLTYKTFTQVVILGSASFVPFMQLPTFQRREVIEDILDIGIFSTMNSILKERISETKEEIQSIDSNITIAKSLVTNQKKLIDSMTTSKKEQLDQIQTQVSDNTIEIESNINKHEQLTDKITELLFNSDNAVILKKESDSITTLRAKFTSKKEQVEETLQFFADNTECPSCAQSIPHEHKLTISEKIGKEYTESVDNLTTLETAYKLLATRQKVFDKLNRQILDLNISANSLLSSNKTLTIQNKKLIEQLNSTRKDTSNIDSEKTNLKEIADKALLLIDKKNILLSARSIQEVSALLLKDTGIKTAIIKEYLPVMNKFINGYLTAMDFYVHFELDESFNEVIKSRFRDEFTYASFSEGEKMRIDLAILFTWRQIARMKNSVNTNLLILDEIFDSSLDNSGTDYFLSIMNTIGDSSNIFVISHKADQLFDKFHSVIKFEKKNDFSTMA